MTTESKPAFEQLLFEKPVEHVARITMNRPDARNAQGLKMTYELNAAFDRAAHDDEVKVIVLAGAGPHFSAGHDLNDRARLGEFEPIGTWGQFGAPGHEGFYGREMEIYLEITERWRNLPKPTIAEVQGKCMAGGNMLAWACDLIIASDDAEFIDHTLELGVCGAEYFAHPFELGVRKAKEWLFTADWLSASEAHRLGMVNHVVPRASLTEFTMALAQRIAKKPMFALKMAKEAVNSAEDVMGRRQAMKTSFGLHQLCHSHNLRVHGMPVDPAGLPEKIRHAIAAARTAGGRSGRE
jgi:enoyl-CoA hydratase